MYTQIGAFGVWFLYNFDLVCLGFWYVQGLMYTQIGALGVWLLYHSDLICPISVVSI
jgi:hypothetical protein